MIGAPRVDPSGRRIVYTVTRMDLEQDRYVAALWLTDLISPHEPRRLTAGTQRDEEPVWSPDGEWIAFTSSSRQEGASQLWAIRASGGESVRLTDLKHGVESHCWSPDGTMLVFVSKVGPDSPGENEPRIVRSIRYRFDGEGYLDERYRQIWVVPFDPSSGCAGSPRQLTEGPFEHRQPAWSPTGREIAFRAARHPNWELGITSDVWVVRLDGGEPRRMTTVEGTWGSPLWSSDGQTLLVLAASAVERAGYANTVLWRVPAAGGEPEPVTAGFDRPIGDQVLGDVPRLGGERVLWPRVDGPVYFLGSDRGSTHIFRVDPGTREITRAVAGERRIGSFDVLPNGGYVFAASAPDDPGDLFVCGPNGEDEHRITDVNAAWRAEVRLSNPEEIWAESDDGVRVQGWLLRPSGVPDSARVPMAVELHGGPLAMYGNGFMHEFQLLAAQGYAVLYSNPRGSTGYGEGFAGRLIGRWGEADQPDVMAMIDAAVERGGIDTQRIGVLGGSYGGILTNWLVGHSDRFKAAVTMRSCSNFVSMLGTDDIAYNTNLYSFGVETWDDPELYWRLSPISYVENVTTPLLIIQNELDFRCPMEQAEQLFVALKRLGRTVEFVRFPNESHGLSRSGAPKHRVERLRHILEWFARYL
jgi:dipeptidyl aminopeptidase/acylaminoacyl peptidase